MAPLKHAGEEVGGGGVTYGFGGCHSPSVDAIFCLVLEKGFWGLFLTVAEIFFVSQGFSFLFALAEMGGLDVNVEEEKISIIEANQILAFHLS